MFILVTLKKDLENGVKNILYNKFISIFLNC
jgi:hypothetical protein